MGTTWRADHPRIRHLVRSGLVGTYIVPADASGEDLQAARCKAVEVHYPEPEPPPVVSPSPKYRCITETIISVGTFPPTPRRAPALVRIVRVDELVAERDWILKARPSHFEKVSAS